MINKSKKREELKKLILDDPDLLKQIMGKLKEEMSDDSDEDENEDDEDGGFTTSIKGKGGRKQGGRGREGIPARAAPIKIRNRKIKFFDDHKEGTKDREFDKKNPCPRTERTRERFVKVKVKCRKCGDVNSVSPALIPTDKKRYVCNGCAVSGG